MAHLFDLPVEIMDMIADHLDQRDLWASTLVCTRLRLCVTPYLYRNVDITDRAYFEAKGDINRLRRFVATLWTRPQLALHVRNLKMLDAPLRKSTRFITEHDWIEFGSPYSPFPQPGSLKEQAFLAEMESLCEDVLYEKLDFIDRDEAKKKFILGHLRTNSRCCLLGLALNVVNSQLETLHLDLDRCSAGTNIAPPINAMTGDTSSYKRLKTVTLRGHDHWHASLRPDLFGDGWAWISTLRTMVVDRCNLLNLKLVKGNASSNLTELRINDCTIFDDIANFTSPNLRTFEVINCRFGAEHSPMLKTDLAQWHCHESLEELRLGGVALQTQSLQAFVALKILALPLQDIIPLWLPKSRQASLASRLPSSIQMLALSDCLAVVGSRPQNSYTALVSALSDLARNTAAGRLQSLLSVETSVCGRDCKHTPSTPLARAWYDTVFNLKPEDVDLTKPGGRNTPVRFSMRCHCNHQQGRKHNCARDTVRQQICKKHAIRPFDSDGAWIGHGSAATSEVYMIENRA